MTNTARPAPFFLADDRALDFLNTIAAPWGTDIEWIGDGQDLLDWLELAGLVSRSVLNRFRRDASPGELDDVAAQARELREWFRAFVTAHAGTPLQARALDDLGTINRLMQRDDGYRQLESWDLPDSAGQSTGSALVWQQQRRWQSPDMLLLPVAEAMGDLVTSVEFTRVKMCEWPPCTMWFHDVSQNHTRRWCMMSVCGNRAKAAAHRARKKQRKAQRPRKRRAP